MAHTQTFTSDIPHKSFPLSQRVTGKAVRHYVPAMQQGEALSRNQPKEKDRRCVCNDFINKLKSTPNIRLPRGKDRSLVIIQQDKLVEIQPIQVKRMNGILQYLEKKINP